MLSDNLPPAVFISANAESGYTQDTSEAARLSQHTQTHRPAAVLMAPRHQHHRSGFGASTPRTARCGRYTRRVIAQADFIGDHDRNRTQHIYARQGNRPRATSSVIIISGNWRGRKHYQRSRIKPKQRKPALENLLRLLIAGAGRQIIPAFARKPALEKRARKPSHRSDPLCARAVCGAGIDWVPPW